MKLLILVFAMVSLALSLLAKADDDKPRALPVEDTTIKGVAPLNVSGDVGVVLNTLMVG